MKTLNPENPSIYVHLNDLFDDIISISTHCQLKQDEDQAIQTSAAFKMPAGECVIQSVQYGERNIKLSICITFLIALLPMVGHGEEKIKHMEPTGVSGVEALSSELRNLLSQEMRALQDGMMSIIPAHAAGNWHEIEIISGKMKNSHILKQSLTKSQAKELHSVLPHEFIEKDQRFHYLAGMLEHAAKNKKPELINFYFSEMNESCVGCHAKFAVHKFPNLKQKIESEHAH